MVLELGKTRVAVRVKAGFTCHVRQSKRRYNHILELIEGDVLRQKFTRSGQWLKTMHAQAGVENFSEHRVIAQVRSHVHQEFRALCQLHKERVLHWLKAETAIPEQQPHQVAGGISAEPHALSFGE